MCPFEFYSRTDSASVVLSSSPAPTGCVDEDDLTCRACRGVRTLRVDWSQGDRVCTQCGVINEGHMMETRAEWREFTEADDLARGRAPPARSGLVPTDESAWWGGLEPTTLSKQMFGGVTTNATSRKSLLAANRRINRRLEKTHRKQLQSAKVTLTMARRRQGEDDGSGNSIHDDVRPDYEKMLMQEEEDAHRMQAALVADKWSLARAIQLYGTVQERPEGDTDDVEELRSRLDKSLIAASQDLYLAYSMLIATSTKLELSDRIRQEAIAMLTKYAARRDGLTVRGIHSAPKSSTGKMTPEAKQMLKEFNKYKQAGSLAAALVFLTARNLSSPRPLADVCLAVQPSEEMKANLYVQRSNPLIQRKHCSKAMTELKATFPEFARAAIAVVHTQKTDEVAVRSLVEHILRKLDLPPAAEACIHCLVLYWKRQEEEVDQPVKLPTLVGALAWFVCLAGEKMQSLALQSTAKSAKRVAPSPPSMPKAKKAKKEEAATKDDRTQHREGTFDLFAVSVEETATEQREYDMRRMWDAWAEQRPWSRTAAQVEQSCGVSRNVLTELYKSTVHDKRKDLLQVLADESGSSSSSWSDLCETPMASILLPHLVVAASLMKAP